MRNKPYIRNEVLSILFSLLFVGCGLVPGDGNGDGGEPPPIVPSIQITMTTPTLSIDSASGDEIPQTVSGSWSGENVQPSDVYIQLHDASGLFVIPETINGSAGAAFTFTVYTLPNVSVGQHTGTIEVRACKDADCIEPYSGGSATVSYTLNVAAVADWETHQRDAAHRGYIPIWLNPSRFAKAWEWARELDDSEPIGGINAVVTSNGKVYITRDVYFGQGVLYALNENDGTEAWRVSFGQVPALSPPAVSNGQIYASVTGHEATALWAFDASTGAYLHKSAFDGQWPHVLAPTVYGDRVYTAGGYYGGETYSFSTVDGALIWVENAGGVWDMFTPAVDDSYVYHHNGAALFLIDPATGVASATITDPFGTSAFPYSYNGSPMIGGRGNAIAFAGATSSGRASSNAEQYDQRVFSSFNINTKSYEWSTSYAYLTAPAVANGVFFAGRKNNMSLDAIDEITGKVLWSWAPTGNGDTEFHRNVVVTRNLLFVSTDLAVYALDLETKAPVWSYPKPGMLAISADRTLYIATGARESDGGLVAVKLK